MGLAVVILIIVGIIAITGFFVGTFFAEKVAKKSIPFNIRKNVSYVVIIACALTILYTVISLWLEDKISLQARVEQNNYKKVQELLEKGADPDSNHYALFVGNYSTSSSGNSQPIRIAYRNDNLDIMLLLLSYGATDAEEVMYQLIEDGNLEYVEAFIDAGIFENTEPRNSYVVHVCNNISDNAPEILRYMLEHGIPQDEISHAIDIVEKKLDKESVSDAHKDKLKELLYILEKHSY
ncbi:MAG: hypothetical protein IJX12_04570 [Lachnospiraceae bacterium]|nr:hypothetical protein [Lachnospiraceae bacterium]